MLLLAALLCSNARAQPPGATWARDPVLSQLLVQQLASTPTGYCWVAADEGVFRYDGYELVPLRKLLPAGQARPPRQHVRAISADAKGRLWIAADEGLFCLEPATDGLRRWSWPHTPKASQWLLLFPHPRSGVLWAFDGEGTVVALNPDRPARLLHFPAPLRFTPVFVQASSGGGLWVSGSKGEVVELDSTGQQRRQLLCPEVVVPVPGSVPLRLLGRTARYVAHSATDATGARIESVRLTARWLPAQPVPTGNQLPDTPAFTDSTLEWAGVRQLVRLRGWQQPDPVVSLEPLGLPEGGSLPTAAPPLRLQYDAQGTRWLYAPTWRGCYKQRPTPMVLSPLRRPDGRPLPSTRAITRLPDGRLLVSTYDGNWTQAAGQPDAPLQLFRLNAPGKQPAPPLLNAALVLPDQTVVVTVAFQGFFRLAPASGDLRPLLPAPGNPMPPKRFVCLLRDRAGRIWGGAEPGLFRLDVARNRYARFRPAGPDSALHRLPINALAQDAGSDRLWVATPGGLYLLDPATGHLRHYGESNATGRALPTDELLTVAAAGPGRAWVGTRTEGLLLVDATTGWQQQLSSAQGLPSPAVADLLVRADTVWAATFAGLVRYVPRSGSLLVLGQAAGLTDAELNRQAAFADTATGRLWFGGVGGVSGLRPNELAGKTPQGPLRLLLTAIVEPTAADPTTPGRVRWLRAGQLPTESLHLGAGLTAYLELHLAVTDRLAPGLVRYTYRLCQATPGHPPLTPWLATPPQLLLRGLAAGQYQLQVRAQTTNGQWTANVLQVPLVVAVVWWQHPIVILIAVLLLLGVGYLAYWLKLRRLRQEARLREKLAANLHDEVGALLTRINFQAQLLRDQHPTGAALHVPGSSVGLDRLISNSAAAVQSMRDVVWSIDARADSAGALLDRMRDYLDQFASPAGPLMTLHTSGLPDAQPLTSNVRQQLYLIFKESLTNALRHAPEATYVQTRLIRQKGILELEIINDAPDSALAATTQPRRRSGQGLRNMAQRARAIGGTLQTGPRPDGQPGFWVRVAMRW